jgi:hypothetical protein
VSFHRLDPLPLAFSDEALDPLSAWIDTGRDVTVSESSASAPQSGMQRDSSTAVKQVKRSRDNASNDDRRHRRASASNIRESEFVSVQ